MLLIVVVVERMIPLVAGIRIRLVSNVLVLGGACANSLQGQIIVKLLADNST
jgi:hypothetical protein